MQTAFRELFGNAPLVRVLDVVLDNHYTQYSMADVLRWTDMSYVTLKPIWDLLINYGILRCVGRTGKADIYTIDESNSIAKKLIELDYEISFAGTEQLAA